MLLEVRLAFLFAFQRKEAALDAIPGAFCAAREWAVLVHDLPQGPDQILAVFDLLAILGDRKVVFCVLGEVQRSHGLIKEWHLGRARGARWEDCYHLSQAFMRAR